MYTYVVTNRQLGVVSDVITTLITFLIPLNIISNINKQDFVYHKKKMCINVYKISKIFFFPHL